MKKQKIIVFSGAGMSAESGIKTFRDSNGLWENHEVSEVASPAAWLKDPKLVLKFYRERYNQLLLCNANAGHKWIKKLEEHFFVQVITQNIDDLHERAGSNKVLHLHGELRKVKCPCTVNQPVLLEGDYIELGDCCENGHQFRPHVVWFGEEVPLLTKAIDLCMEADYFVVIGTSLNVYPAANLIHYLKPGAKAFLIDPKASHMKLPENWTVLETTASQGMKVLYESLMQKKGQD